MRKTAHVKMSLEEWEVLRDEMQRWMYSACRSDVETDHPQGIRVLDEPLNELCRHIEVVEAENYHLGDGE